MPRPGQKTSTDAIDRVKRQREALEMRIAGMTQQQIADRMGVSKTTIHRYLRDAMKEVIEEPALEVLRLELIRLDNMQLALRSKALKGDERAIQTILKIQERRARYLSLDGALDNSGDNGEGIIAKLADTVDKMYQMRMSADE